MEERFTVRMLREAAESLGMKYVVEPEFGHVGYLESETGKRFFFKLSALDVNPLGASKIAIDKAYTQFFLKEFGYPTIPTEVFFSDGWCAVNETKNNLAAALDYAERAGYPRIIKPNSKSQGRGVVKAYTPEELLIALEAIFAIDPIALVQPCVEGRDYRIVVYKDAVVAAYSRTPLTIVGDGTKKIIDFLPKSLSASTVATRVKRVYNVTLDSVPKAGEQLQLLDNANLSTGGLARDVTDSIGSETKNLAVHIARDMGLALAGIDILTTDDISKAMVDYVIVEVNAMPGLEHFAALGNDQLVRVKNLYTHMISDALQI